MMWLYLFTICIFMNTFQVHPQGVLDRALMDGWNIEKVDSIKDVSASGLSLIVGIVESFSDFNDPQYVINSSANMIVVTKRTHFDDKGNIRYISNQRDVYSNWKKILSEFESDSSLFEYRYAYDSFGRLIELLRFDVDKREIYSGQRYIYDDKNRLIFIFDLRGALVSVISEEIREDRITYVEYKNKAKNAEYSIFSDLNGQLLRIERVRFLPRDRGRDLPVFIEFSYHNDKIVRKTYFSKATNKYINNIEYTYSDGSIISLFDSVGNFKTTFLKFDDRKNWLTMIKMENDVVTTVVERIIDYQ